MLQEEEQDKPESTCEDECNGELHKLIQERVNKNFFPSLQALSANVILDNFELFSDNEGMSPLSVKLLSENVRQSLLELLEARHWKKMNREMPQHYFKLEDQEYFNKMFATFQQLVGPKCKKFDLDWLLVFCPGQDSDRVLFGDKALNTLALEAPMLESLVFGYKPLWGSMYEPIREHDWIKSSFRLQIYSLHNLTSLKMPGQGILPEDLILIGQQLPHLELLLCSLRGNSGELLCATVKMIENLPSFRHFIFDDIQVLPHFSVYFYRRFCFMNFPQLHTIGLIDLPFLHMEFKPKIKSQLTRLLFCGGTTDLQVLQCVISNNLMPNVSHLLIQLDHGQTWDPMLFNLVTRFPNLSELTLEGIGNERKFLLAYGPNLLKLTLGHHMYGEPLDIPLEELVELCPKLEELCLRDCQGPAPVIFPDPELPTLDSLTQLDLGWHIPYPIDSLLMIAPNIKRITIRVVQPSYEDQIKRLTELIKSRRVCQKVVSLKIFLGWKSYNEEREDLLKVFVALGELAKVMCAYVPTLEEVYFGIFNQDIDSALWQEVYYEDGLLDIMLPFVNNFCLRKCLDVVDAVHGKYRLRHEWYRV